MSQDDKTSGYVAPIDTAEQIDSGEISYHIIQIIPNNRDFLDPNTVLSAQLNEMKFDVSAILSNREFYEERYICIIIFSHDLI